MQLHESNKVSTFRWEQYFDNTENKNMKRKKYSFKIPLPRPISLGMGKIISSIVWQLLSFLS